MTASPTSGSAPQRFGPYLVLDELGRGAMGAVYRARDERAGREVALKVLLPNADLNSLVRLQREGVLTAALNHPGIVGIHDAGEIDGTPYLVYELVPGARTLEEVLPEVSREERIELVKQVALAVGHAHAAGVIHRDLKPSNVLVTPEGQVKVADFGLASHENAERLTETNAIVGTPLYMSPEQIAAARHLIGPPADVWALGVLLYYALTLELPFEGVSLIELAGAIMTDTPDPVRQHDPTIPRLYERVLAGALARPVLERFPDGAAFAAAMEGEFRAARIQRPLLVGLAALALLALALAPLLGLRLRALRATPTPTPSLPSPAALEEALEQQRWDEVEGALASLPDAAAWRVRLALAREGAEAAERSLAAASDLDEVTRILLQARIASAGQASALDVLGAARLRLPDALGLRCAEAELLLRAGRVPRARDVLGKAEALAPSAARWCDPRALESVLELALERDPAQGPAGAGLSELLRAPPAWRAGVALWLLDESEFLLERLRLREDPRFRSAREEDFPPATPEDLRAAIRWRLEAAAALGAPASQAALLRLQLLVPAAERAQSASAALLGSPGGWSVLGAAEACLAQGQPVHALRVLESLRAAPEGEIYRPGEQAQRQEEQQRWLRAQALLARDEAEPSRRAALAELVAADALAGSRHLGIAEDLHELRTLLGEPSPDWKRRRGLLAGDKAEEAARLLAKRRSQRRESGPTDVDVAEILALDPVSPAAHYYEARRLLNSDWNWKSLRRVQSRIREQPFMWTDFARLVQQALRPSQEEALFLRHGLIEKMQGQLPAEFVEGHALILGLRAEVEGLTDPADLRRRLAVLDAALTSSPGAWELRPLRALVELRLGHLRAARVDLELTERGWPSVGDVSFVRTLLLAAEGQTLEVVLAELKRTRLCGYKRWGHPAWSLSQYPELAGLRGQAAFDELLVSLRGKVR